MKRILLIFFIVLLSLPCFAGRVQQAHKAVITAKNGAVPPSGIDFDSATIFQDGYNAATESWSHTVTGTNIAIPIKPAS